MLTAFAKASPRLEVIEFEEANRISREGLFALAKHCPRLRNVMIEGEGVFEEDENGDFGRELSVDEIRAIFPSQVKLVLEGSNFKE